ncbi:MAG TPA: pilus assembly protein PilM [Phycisphaerales bacterium]|nr:pilus assembly protein PilM [Phycisphaerales bacterium]
MGLGSLLKFKQAPALAKLGDVLNTSVGVRTGTLSPIAIDLGAGSLKMMQVDGAEPPTLVAAASIETPVAIVDDPKRRLDFQLEALPKLLRSAGFKGKRAVCAIPAWKTTIKHLQFPREPNLGLAVMVEAAIRQQLGADPASLAYRFIEVNTPDKPAGRVDVILIAVTRDVVAYIMRALAGARLEPVGIHSEFVCALHAFDHLHRREGDLQQNTLYVDLGATASKVCIAHGRDLVFARCIGIGGHDLDKAISEQLALTPADARKRRMALDDEAGAPPEPAPAPHVSTAADPEADRRLTDTPPGFGDVTVGPSVPAAPGGVDVSEPLEMLTDEIKLSLRHHASQFPSRKIDRVVFVGGESRHRGLTQHIARTLRLPAQVADPIARVARSGKEPCIGVDLKKPQPGWAVALGLCLAPTDL